MANHCINIAHASTGDRELLEEFIRLVEEEFSIEELDLHGSHACELNFMSRYRFPLAEMERIASRLPEGNDLYINIVSTERSEGYVAMHTYQRGVWTQDNAGHSDSGSGDGSNSSGRASIPETTDQHDSPNINPLKSN
ncbi:MAG: hypothetical protein LBH06_04235 [Rikenellaceae bacterium]|jgi:hypothetical protein|nr:hypothetical protein [Rikenellaceae bacterium]